MGAEKIAVVVVVAILHCFQWTNAIINVDLSKPALQKCEVNKLEYWNGDVTIPYYRMSTNKTFAFRVTEKCATRLPHCMQPCPLAMLPKAVPLSRTDGVKLQFTEKGYFRYDNQYFSPDEFCLFDIQEENLIVKICPSGCYEEGTPLKYEVCVPKCCSIDKVVDVNFGNCQFSNSKDIWAPLLYRSASRQVCGDKRTHLKVKYVQSPPRCAQFQRYFLKSIPGNTRVRFRLLTNGTLLLRDIVDLKLQWKTLEKGTYCMDGIQNYGSDPRPYSADPTDQILLHCVQDNDDPTVSSKLAGNQDDDREGEEVRLDATGISYVILLFSGVPFLLVTAIVYVLVWSKQNVHGWTIFSHTLAMLLHYLAQAVANTVSRIFNHNQNASYTCKFIGISNHFFVLAAFCWLTIINYDLFSMFRHLKTTIGRSRGMKRFLAYMAIAWGIPLLVVTMSVLLDSFYGLYGDDGDCEADVIVPLYGHRTCYMVEDARPYYLYYPVGILMALNLVLAGMTLFNMYKHDESAKMAVDKSRTKHRRKFSVMAKLFVVMGLVWVFDVIVFLGLKKDWETLPWYLAFPDVLNALQAVAIFILFACQPKILNQVSDSYPSLRPAAELLKRLQCTGKKQQQSGTASSSGGPPASPASKMKALKG